jgi:hypothetical protein
MGGVRLLQGAPGAAVNGAGGRSNPHGGRAEEGLRRTRALVTPAAPLHATGGATPAAAAVACCARCGGSRAARGPRCGREGPRARRGASIGECNNSTASRPAAAFKDTAPREKPLTARRTGKQPCGSRRCAAYKVAPGRSRRALRPRRGRGRVPGATIAPWDLCPAAAPARRAQSPSPRAAARTSGRRPRCSPATTRGWRCGRAVRAARAAAAAAAGRPPPPARATPHALPPRPQVAHTGEVPFRKILSANRGEIAIRTFRAGTELGLRTVGWGRAAEGAGPRRRAAAGGCRRGAAAARTLSRRRTRRPRLLSLPPPGGHLLARRQAAAPPLQRRRGLL